MEKHYTLIADTSQAGFWGTSPTYKCQIKRKPRFTDLKLFGYLIAKDLVARFILGSISYPRVAKVQGDVNSGWFDECYSFFDFDRFFEDCLACGSTLVIEISGFRIPIKTEIEFILKSFNISQDLTHKNANIRKTAKEIQKDVTEASFYFTPFPETTP